MAQLAEASPLKGLSCGFESRRGHVRHRRLRGAVSIAFALALAAGCAGGEGSASPTVPTETAASPTTAPTTSTTTVVAARPFAVERTELVVEDTSRPTAAVPDHGLPERPTRTIPLLVLAPAGDGPFPIVVFAHGVNSSGPAYETFLTRIAEAGYVVVAPTFPLSNGPDGQIFDYTNQPGDVYFALDAVVARAEDPDDPLSGRVDGDVVALAGHSLGAMTTVGAAFHSCCADPRVDAAVLLSGVEPPFPGGDYDARPPTPLLLAHGALDPTIGIAGSEGLAAVATGPVAFLRFPAGSHSDILVNEAGELLATAMIAWFDRWLLGDAGGLEVLPPAVEASGIATLELDVG